LKQLNHPSPFSVGKLVWESVSLEDELFVQLYSLPVASSQKSNPLRTLANSSHFGVFFMQTFTAKEAKNRLGKVIDLALTEKAVAISKNGRDSVVLVSAEYFRELCGQHGFLKDSHSEAKNKRRIVFSNDLKSGYAKSADASMFNGLKTTVLFTNENF